MTNRFNEAAPVPLSLHTAEEAATILRVRQSWLERQAAARRIPFTMLGGSYRFTDSHLAEVVRIFEATPTHERADPEPATRSVRRPRRRADAEHSGAPV